MKELFNVFFNPIQSKAKQSKAKQSKAMNGWPGPTLIC